MKCIDPLRAADNHQVTVYKIRKLTDSPKLVNAALRARPCNIYVDISDRTNAFNSSEQCLALTLLILSL